MNENRLQKRINLVRRDLGNLLFHFTRKPDSKVEIKNDKYNRTLPQSALSVLEKILSDGSLKGSSNNIRGGFKCICFTESPISELASLFSLINIAESLDDKTRYEPYGVAVKKEWLFSKGGRPVIYQPESDFKLLPDKLKYRHVRYEPDQGIDYTWEREWRIKVEHLNLNPKETLVVVPDAESAFDLVYQHSNVELDYDNEPIPQGSYHVAKWMAVSLDLFGFKVE
ncbi:MAG: hypothetical protein U5R06_17975 [candidate division KSB1 bacterium]|nr:hypothetical protein [candidate division KSB1 bacterium]